MKKPVLPMILALAFGWAWFGFSSVAVQAQSSATKLPIEIFVDSRGDTLPSTDRNLPFKLISGYPEYKVGPGDILEIITVEGSKQKTDNVRVQPDGTVSFSVLHAIEVRDLALVEVKKALQDSLAEFVHSPRVQ